MSPLQKQPVTPSADLGSKSGGRYRIRTYDIFDVNEALYR